MDPSAAPAICIYGARAARKSLRILSALLRTQRRRARRKAGAVPAPEDTGTIRAIHDMRVATRRLRSALEPHGCCVTRQRLEEWHREIRILRLALGDARDADVQIGQVSDFLHNIDDSRYKPGIERLLDRLRRRRRKLQKDVAAAVGRMHDGRVLEQMSETAASLCGRGRARGVSGAAATAVRRQAAAVIRGHLADLLALEPCVRHARQIKRHHAMRIAAKRLRYSIDVYKPVYGTRLDPFIDAARAVQNRLGEIHDCDIWVEWLPRFLEKERRRADRQRGAGPAIGKIEPGIMHLRKDRRRLRARRFREFAAFWKKLRKQAVWDRLEDALRE
jgi:CHAD domain-containing protein